MTTLPGLEMLATHHRADIRDPQQAVDLAERATRLAGRPDVSILDTLAAAYAAANRYEQAVAVARARHWN